MNVATRSFAGELRINLGPAIQVEALGQQGSSPYKNMTDFHPLGILFVGGVNLPYESILRLSIGNSEGFVGKIYKVKMDKNEYMLHDSTLTTNDKYVDSASVSLAGTYVNIRNKH